MDLGANVGFSVLLWLSLFPEARVQAYDDVGHYVMEDAPELFLQAEPGGSGLLRVNSVDVTGKRVLELGCGAGQCS